VKQESNSVITELASYVGSKRRVAERIVSEIPEGAKAIFDPTCGVAHVLLACRKRGMKVLANDANPIAHWYSRAALGADKLSDSDVETLISAKPVKGWLSNVSGMKQVAKVSPDVKSFIDGLAAHANNLSGAKKTAAMGLVANVLMTLQGNLSFASEPALPKFQIERIRAMVKKSAAEINAHVSEGPAGVVTMLDIEKLSVPKVDVIYFDPPYDEKSESENQYDNQYRVISSILMQKDWKSPKFQFDRIPEYLNRFIGKTKMVLVSSSADSRHKYRELLEKGGKEVKLKIFNYSGSRMLGRSGSTRREYLWIAHPKGGVKLAAEETTLSQDSSGPLDFFAAPILVGEKSNAK
jgi:16S rRNA G966 N2-methylase RsmD/cytochrome c5